MSDKYEHSHSDHRKSAKFISADCYKEFPYVIAGCFKFSYADFIRFQMWARIVIRQNKWSNSKEILIKLIVYFRLVSNFQRILNKKTDATSSNYHRKYHIREGDSRGVYMSRNTFYYNKSVQRLDIILVTFCIISINCLWDIHTIGMIPTALIRSAQVTPFNIKVPWTDLMIQKVTTIISNFWTDLL